MLVWVLDDSGAEYLVPAVSCPWVSQQPTNLRVEIEVETPSVSGIPSSASTHQGLLSHQTTSLRTFEMPCYDFYTSCLLNLIIPYFFFFLVAIAAPELM